MPLITWLKWCSPTSLPSCRRAVASTWNMASSMNLCTTSPCTRHRAKGRPCSPKASPRINPPANHDLLFFLAPPVREPLRILRTSTRSDCCGEFRIGAFLSLPRAFMMSTMRITLRHSSINLESRPCLVRVHLLASPGTLPRPQDAERREDRARKNDCPRCVSRSLT